MPWERKQPRGIGGVAVIESDMALPRAYRKAAKRARQMGTTQLLEYADTSLSGIGRCLTEHGRMPGAGDRLREAEEAAASLYAVLREAASRQPVPYPETLPGANMGIAAARQG